VIRIFVKQVGTPDPPKEIKDLYWFEENGVHTLTDWSREHSGYIGVGPHGEAYIFEFVIDSSDGIGI